MKLKSVEISEFKCIRNSTSFDIDDITCLVGKNESGKTALLQALYRLNPIIESEGDFDVTDDYPRAIVADYRLEVESEEREPANVVKAEFELEPSDLEELKKNFGEKLLKSTRITLCKGYDNDLHASLDLNEKIAVGALCKRARLEVADNKVLSTCSSLGELESTLDGLAASEGTTRLKAELSNVQEDGLSSYLYNTYLSSSLPRFLYFDEYYQMTGQENIEQLIQRMNSPEQRDLKRSDYPLLGLIELARLSLPELLKADRTEGLINNLEGASNHLTKKVLKYWSQNKHLQMRFDVRSARPGDPEGMTAGTNIWARVYDSRHLVTTPLGSRSRGFVWFFSFLAWFDQQQRKDEPLILLLDEPGLSLHAKV